VRIYATYNVKGGVGKTSAAVNLAYLASRDGRKTLLWDLDAQAAATYLFRVRPRVKGGGKALVRGARPLDAAIKGTDFENLDLLPADFTYRKLDLRLHEANRPTRQIARLLAPLAGEYDAVFLDCPPSISLVTENVLHAADALIVPLIPTPLCTRTLDQLTTFVGALNGRRPAIVAFFSMADRRKKLHRDILADLPGQRADVAGAAIPAMSVIEQMAVRRAPLPVYSPRGVATRRYRELWREISAWPATAPTDRPVRRGGNQPSIRRISQVDDREEGVSDASSPPEPRRALRA